MIPKYEAGNQELLKVCQQSVTTDSSFTSQEGMETL